MELSEVMRTTPSTRSFTGAPVDDAVVHRILDHARFAPSGGNRQAWHVIVIRDPQLRAGLGELYRLGWREYKAHVKAGKVPFSPGATRHSQSWVDLAEARVTPVPGDFADNLEHHPVLLVVTVELASLAVLDHGLPRQSIVGGASIYPFCHNVMLKARDEGLGGVMTTTLCRQEPAAAELIGIPDTHAIAALIVIGHPTGHMSKLTRRSVGEFTTVDRFDGAPFVT